MSALTDSTVTYLSGGNPPLNDTDPYGGAAITTNDISATENSPNTTLFGPISLPSSGSVPYYGVGYRQITSVAPSSANNPRIYNRAGAVVNILGGNPRIICSNADVGTSGSAAGIGLQIRLLAQVGGTWTPQWINLNGATFSSDVAGGYLAVDAGTAYRWELALNGSPTTISSDVACYIDSQLCAVIRGSGNPRRGITGQGNNFASAEIKVAVAVSKNSSLAGTNRLTAPSAGIGTPASVLVGAFAPAVFFPGGGSGSSLWVGSDQSLVIPGGPLMPGDYFGYCLQFTAYNIPAPLGNFVADIGFLTNPGN